MQEFKEHCKSYYALQWVTSCCFILVHVNPLTWLHCNVQASPLDLSKIFQCKFIYNVAMGFYACLTIFNITIIFLLYILQRLDNHVIWMKNVILMWSIFLAHRSFIRIWTVNVHADIFSGSLVYIHFSAHKHVKLLLSVKSHLRVFCCCTVTLTFSLPFYGLLA